MGQTMTPSKYRPPKGEEVNRNQFQFVHIIGRGGFGKVWKVIDKKNKNEYALKEMQKVKVIDKRSEKAIKYERELLSQMSHPFIVNMHYSFQDYDNLYIVMDLLVGGDLRYHISRRKTFTEEQTICIILALEYIHSKNILHRDIKPENLVLDNKGYVRITDFGIAKEFSTKNANETSGTPGYMSPEVMSGQNHSFPVDYFALGVIGYEFMLGKRPYLGRSRKEIKEKMMTKLAYIKESAIPDGWNKEAGDFINKLLIRKPEGRLGNKGIFELKEHPWIKDYDWNGLINKTIKAPFYPTKRDNYDKKYCESIDKIGYETKHRYERIRNSLEYPSLFFNYTFYAVICNKMVTSNNNNTLKEYVNSSIPIKISTIKKAALSPSNSLNSLLQYSKKRAQSASPKNFHQEDQSSSKISLLATKRDNKKHLQNTKRSSIHSHFNLNKKSKGTLANSPTNKNTSQLKRTVHMMSLSPMSFKSFQNPFNNSSSSSNHIKQNLIKNCKKAMQKAQKKKFIPTILNKAQNQTNTPKNNSKQIQRSNSNFFNQMSKQPLNEKNNLLLSTDTLNNKTANNISINTNSQSLTRRSSHNSNQIIINSTINAKQLKMNNKQLIHSNSINFLFKNYKMKAKSSNSTGNSSLSTNRAHFFK